MAGPFGCDGDPIRSTKFRSDPRIGQASLIGAR